VKKSRPAWAQRPYEVDTVVAAWNDVGELVNSPGREARADVQRVPEHHRKLVVLLAKQVESGWLPRSRNAGVEENVAARWSPGGRQVSRNSREQRTGAAVSNEYRWRRRVGHGDLARCQRHVPLGERSLVIILDIDHDHVVPVLA